MTQPQLELWPEPCRSAEDDDALADHLYGMIMEVAKTWPDDPQGRARYEAAIERDARELAAAMAPGGEGARAFWKRYHARRS